MDVEKFLLYGHSHQFKQKKWWQFWKKKKFDYTDGKNFMSMGSIVNAKSMPLYMKNNKS